MYMDFFPFLRYNNTMEYLFLLISVVSGTAKSAFSKLLSPHTRRLGGFGRINALLSLSACTVILTVGLLSHTLSHSPYTVLCGILFGVCTAAAQYFYLLAFTRGAVSVVTFIYACGFLLPTLAGTLVWHETLTPVTVCGVLLLLCAFLLCAGVGEQSTPGTKHRYGYAFLAMLCSGMIGILQKLHQTSSHRAEGNAFLITAFLVSAAISALLAAVGQAKDKAAEPLPPLPAKACLCALLSGIFIGAANDVNLRLSGLLPAAVCFPVTNGGVVVCAAVTGRLLFGEHLTRNGYRGILLGVIAIVLIGLGK